jgi:hypothetical protein
MSPHGDIQGYMSTSFMAKIISRHDLEACEFTAGVEWTLSLCKQWCDTAIHCLSATSIMCLQENDVLLFLVKSKLSNILPSRKTMCHWMLWCSVSSVQDFKRAGISRLLKEKGRKQFWPKKGNLRRTRKNLKNWQNFTTFRVNKMLAQDIGTAVFQCICSC